MLSFGQEKPEKVVSFVKDAKPFEWYVKQYDLWNVEVKSNPKNEAAWENLYASARMAQLIGDSESIKEKWNEKEKEVVDRISKNIKETYTYYRIMAWENSIWKETDPAERERIMQYTMKAYELRPESGDVYPELMNIYEIHKYNSEKLKEVATKWRASGDITPNLSALAYNMLLNTKENSILITGGDNDTYPLWIAQQADNFRKDVTVLNIYLAQVPYYRNRIFKQLGIPELAGENLDFDVIIKHIITHKKNRTLYFTSNHFLTDKADFQKQLYNVGVVYQYASEGFNNEAVLVANFENKLMTDHLYFPYYQSAYPAMDRRHNCLYLSGLMLLHKHYVLVDEKAKAEKTKGLLVSLSKDTEFSEDVNKAIGVE